MRRVYFCRKCRDRSWLIECKCGCHEVIPRINKKSQVASYKHGHNWQGKNHTDETKQKLRDLNYGEKNPNYKGWRYKDGEGYIRVHMPDGSYQKEHRLIYEQYHGVKLTSEDEINHLDKEPTNNDPKNLLKMTKSQHTKWHWDNGDFKKQG